MIYIFNMTNIFKTKNDKIVIYLQIILSDYLGFWVRGFSLNQFGNRV